MLDTINNIQSTELNLELGRSNCGIIWSLLHSRGALGDLKRFWNLLITPTTLRELSKHDVFSIK